MTNVSVRANSIQMVFLSSFFVFGKSFFIRILDFRFYGGILSNSVLPLPHAYCFVLRSNKRRVHGVLAVSAGSDNRCFSSRQYRAAAELLLFAFELCSVLKSCFLGIYAFQGAIFVLLI